jgi:hypothetical protein
MTRISLPEPLAPHWPAWGRSVALALSAPPATTGRLQPARLVRQVRRVRAAPDLLSLAGRLGATGASFGGSAVAGIADGRSYSVAEDHSSAHLSHHTITHPGYYYGPAWTTQSHHLFDYPALGLEWVTVGVCVVAVVKKAWDDS